MWLVSAMFELGVSYGRWPPVRLLLLTAKFLNLSIDDTRVKQAPAAGHLLNLAGAGLAHVERCRGCCLTPSASFSD